MGLAAVIAVTAGLAPGAAVGPAAALDSEATPTAWVLDRVRIEPVGPDPAPVTVAGLGDYRGAVEVTRQGGGLAVVNDVGLEDYVRGILEVPATWPTAALEAQAIAARTFALNSAAGSMATPWRDAGADICATDSCQVYRGLEAERRPGGEAWVAAVEGTAGRVLLSGGRPILAMYSSSNGGRSRPGSASYLRSVADPDDATSPLSHWHYTVPLAEVAPVLGVIPPLTLVGLRRNGDSVVLTVALPKQPPSDHVIATTDFTNAFNAGVKAPPGLPRPLPTGDFNVGIDSAGVVVDGHGWGHGIGMSQYGAYGKARRGLKAADILAAYYGGLRPSPMPDGQPATVRVALALGSGPVRVSSPGPFRILDGAGNTVAAPTSGESKLVAAGRGVRVVAPEGWEPPADPSQPVVAVTPGGATVVGHRSPARVLVAAPTMPGRGLQVVLAAALAVWACASTFRLHRRRRIPLV